MLRVSSRPAQLVGCTAHHTLLLTWSCGPAIYSNGETEVSCKWFLISAPAKKGEQRCLQSVSTGFTPPVGGLEGQIRWALIGGTYSCLPCFTIFLQACGFLLKGSKSWAMSRGKGFADYIIRTTPSEFNIWEVYDDTYCLWLVRSAWLWPCLWILGGVGGGEADLCKFPKKNQRTRVLFLNTRPDHSIRKCPLDFQD